MRAFLLGMWMTPLLVGCAGDATEVPARSVGSVDVAGLEAAMKAGEVVLIDVRTPAEFATGHVPGARNIPLSELDDRLDTLDKSRTVHLICQAGGRSARGAAMMAAKGFTTINVEGGTGAWKASGRTVE